MSEELLLCEVWAGQGPELLVPRRVDETPGPLVPGDVDRTGRPVVVWQSPYSELQPELQYPAPSPLRKDVS